MNRGWMDRVLDVLLLTMISMAVLAAGTGLALLWAYVLVETL